MEGRRCTSRAARAGNTASDTAGRTGEFAQGGQRIAEQDEVRVLSLTGGGEEVGGGWEGGWWVGPESQWHPTCTEYSATWFVLYNVHTYFAYVRMYVCPFVYPNACTVYLPVCTGFLPGVDHLKTKHLANCPSLLPV